MRRRLSVLVLAASILLPGSALAAGEVGDPPSLDFKRCDEFLRPCTEAVILAAGEHFLGRVEVVGFGSSGGLCLGADTFDRTGTSGFFGCGGEGAPADGKAVSVDAIGGSNSSETGKATQILGTVRSDVAAVRVRYRRNGTPRRTAPIFNQLDRELTSRIGQGDQFGVFEATVRGCVEPPRFRVTAFGSDGAALGTDRAPRFGDFCDISIPPPGPPPPSEPVKPARKLWMATSDSRRFEH